MRPSGINNAARPPAPENGTRLRPAENAAPCPLPTDTNTATPPPSPNASPSVPSSNSTPSFPSFVPDSTTLSPCSCRDITHSPSFVKRFEEILKRFYELYPWVKLDDATTSDKASSIRCANCTVPTPQVPSEHTKPPNNTNNSVSVSETADTCGVSPVESAPTVPSPEKKSDSVPTSSTSLAEPKGFSQPLDKDDPSTLPSRESDSRTDINLTPVKPDPSPLLPAVCPHSEPTDLSPTFDKTTPSVPPSIFYNPASSLPPFIPDNRTVSPLPPIPANPPPSLRSSFSDNAIPLLTSRKNNTRGPSFGEHLECLLKKLYPVSPRPGKKDADTTFAPGKASPSPVQSAASSSLDSTTCLPKSDNTTPSLHASIPGSTTPLRASISSSITPSIRSSILGSTAPLPASISSSTTLSLRSFPSGTTPSLPSSIPSSTHSICSCKDITRDQSFDNPASSLPSFIPDNHAVSPLPPIPANPPPSLSSSISDNAIPLLTHRKNNTRGPSFAEHIECLLKKLYPVCPCPGEKDADTTFAPGKAGPSPVQPEACLLDSTTCLPKSDNTAPSLHPSTPSPGLTSPKTIPPEDTNTFGPQSDLPTPSGDNNSSICIILPSGKANPSSAPALDTNRPPNALLETASRSPLFDLYPYLAVDPSFFPIAPSDSSCATSSVTRLVDSTPSLPASRDTDGTPSASLKPHMLEKSTSTSLFDLYPSLAVDPSFFPIASSDSRGATSSAPPLVDGTPTLPESLDNDEAQSTSLKPHMLETGSLFHPLKNIDSSEYRLKYLHLWRPSIGRPTPLLHKWSTFIVIAPVSDTDLPNLWVPAPSVADSLASPSEDASVCFLTITDSSVPPLLDVTVPASIGIDGNLFDHHPGISDTFPTPVVDTNVSPCTTSYIDLTTPAPAATDIYVHSSKIATLAPLPSRTTYPIVESSASASPPSVYTDFVHPPEATTPIVERGASSSCLSVDTDSARPPEVTTPIVESGASSENSTVNSDCFRPPEATSPIVESSASASRPSVYTNFSCPPEATTPIVESSASASPPSVYTDFARPPEATSPIVESSASASPPSVYTNFARPPEATTPIVESGASSSPLSVDTDCTLPFGSTLQESGVLLSPTMDMNPSVPPLEKVHSCTAPSIEYKNICFPLKKYQHLWSTLEGIPTSLLPQNADISLPGCSDHSAPPFMSPDLPPQLLGKSDSLLVPSGIPDYSSSTTEKAYVSTSQQHDLPVKTHVSDTSLLQSNTQDVSPVKNNFSIASPVKTDVQDVFPVNSDLSVASPMATDVPVVSPQKKNIPVAFVEESDIQDIFPLKNDLSVITSGENDVQVVRQVNRSVTFDTDILTFSYERDSHTPCSCSGSTLTQVGAALSGSHSAADGGTSKAFCAFQKESQRKKIHKGKTSNQELPGTKKKQKDKSSNRKSNTERSWNKRGKI
ncbi:mucin-2-like [Pleurodeles waltl]|uniref:mucin-2-like n=1 Tax=Pleurodeles waltl TaxID=8319 RepID=UPI003709A247